MSIIGLGMAALGRPEYINIRQDIQIDTSEIAFRKNAFEVLDMAYAQGIRFYDTAPSYGKGESFLQDWVESRAHSDVVLSTKWGYTYVANWELGYPGAHEVKEHSLAKLQMQWELSKKLLPQLNYYQIHSATFESGVLDNSEVLHKLEQIKSETGMQIGLTVSGHAQEAILQRAAAIQVGGAPLFDSFQATLNILEHHSLDTLKALLKAGKTVIVKEGLANGRVFSKQHADLQQCLQAIASRYQTGIDAVALRYIIDVLQPTVVLSGAATASQLIGNCEALDFKLNSMEIEKLSAFGLSPKAYWDQRAELPWN